MKFTIIKNKGNLCHDINMATVGKFDEYYCYIYSNEGINIPHFHLENKQDNIHIAVKILKPEYFIHGKYKYKLNSKDKKDLIEFLNDYVDFDKSRVIFKNNYEYICYLWKKETENSLDYKNIKMPDYNLLK